jgi:hypothetical protein
VCDKSLASSDAELGCAAQRVAPRGSPELLQHRGDVVLGFDWEEGFPEVPERHVNAVAVR